MNATARWPRQLRILSKKGPAAVRVHLPMGISTAAAPHLYPKQRFSDLRAHATSAPAMPGYDQALQRLRCKPLAVHNHLQVR